MLYDVSTLYFETDTGDGFRKPGFSKKRRLEPQITIGLLTDETELAVEGKAPVKRNRFITLTDATKTVNHELEAKARTLAGWKSYVTNLPDTTRRVRHQLVPATVQHREIVSHVQTR